VARGVIFTLLLCAAGHALAAPPVRELRVVPQGLVGVSFSGQENARVESMSLASAIERKSRIARSPGGSREGSEAWFFHGFTRDALYFFVGRLHVRCAGLGCMEYRTDVLYQVQRTPPAERELGVDQTVRLWESGIRGVRGGMTAPEVEAVLGKPDQDRPEQLVGSFSWIYRDAQVVFLANRVAFFHVGR
jgi:hypothetical protein